MPTPIRTSAKAEDIGSTSMAKAVRISFRNIEDAPFLESDTGLLGTPAHTEQQTLRVLARQVKALTRCTQRLGGALASAIPSGASVFAQTCGIALRSDPLSQVFRFRERCRTDIVAA